jgi:hypothetical protein
MKYAVEMGSVATIYQVSHFFSDFLIKIRFVIILSFTHRSFERSFSFMFFDQDFELISDLSYTCYMPVNLIVHYLAIA